MTEATRERPRGAPEPGAGDGTEHGEGHGEGHGERAEREVRGESREEQADRRWAELLQEVRVTQTGTQILFGFLLAVVFHPGFEDLSSVDENLYVLTVLLGAATTGALIAPVAFHRLVHGERLKTVAVAWASRLTVLGLVLLLCTMASALLLVLRVAVHDGLAAWLVGGAVTWFTLCWFALPAWARRSRAGRAAD